jgi:putative membrane protein
VAPRSLAYRWLISGLGLLIATVVVPGLHYDGGVIGFVVLALILGLLNALLKPIVAFLTCPLLLLTLGLFMLVVNAAMLLAAAWLGRSIGIPFRVDGFGSAFVGGIVISLVSLFAAAVVRDNR